MGPGRNDPCPCGSGKKYKHCCRRLEQAPAVEDLWSRLNRVDAELARTLLDHAKKALRPEALDVGRRDFYGNDVEEIPTRDLQMFIPWLIYSWVPSENLWRVPRGPDDRHTTVGRDYLMRKGRRLEDISRRYLEASLAEPFSFFEVVSVEAGASVDFVDLLRGRPCHVSERSASRVLTPHDIVWAHFVSLDGLTTMSGGSSIPLEPEAKIEIIDLAERLRGRRRGISEEALFAEADLIRLTYLRLTERRVRPPVLSNTDGEPLSLHRLTFRIDDPAAAFEALHSLDLVSSREEILAKAKRDRQGTLQSVEICWNKLGNRQNKSWHNTILGQLKIDGRRLVAEVNSKKRADRIRAQIEKRLGSGVSFERAVVTSPEKMLEEARNRLQPAQERERSREEEELLSSPELREHVTRMLERHYEAWVDEKLPALGGQTPRQAVRAAAGRAKVEALLEGMERRPPAGPFDQRPPVARLREKLGLS